MRYFNLVVSSIILAVLMVGGASAASFNCSKAATSYEKAICVDPALSELDELLAASYNQTRDGLGQAGRDAVLANQREWIHYAERACAGGAAPLKVAYDEDGRYCLESVLRDRIDDLSFDHEVGPYAVFEIHRYRAVKDTDFEEWNRAGQKSLSYPVFAGGDQVAAINAAILDIVNPALSDFDNDYEIDGYSDDDLSVAIEAVTSQRISFSEGTYSYGHGAAHGNYSVNYVHYLTQEQRVLREIDIFSDANWPNVAMPEVVASLIAVLGEDGVWLDDPRSILNSLINTNRWILSPDGISFQFQPYEVSSYAAGAPIAQVPWEVFDGMLAHNALVIAGVQ